MGSKIARTKKVKVVIQNATSNSSIKQATKSDIPGPIASHRTEQDTTSWAKIAAGAESAEGKLPANSAQYRYSYPFKPEIFYGPFTTATPKTVIESCQQDVKISKTSLDRTPLYGRNNSITTTSSTSSLDSKNSNDSNETLRSSEGTSLTDPSEGSDEDKISRNYKLVNDRESLLNFLSIIDTVEYAKVDLFCDAEGSSQHDRHHKLNGLPIKMVSTNEKWLLDPVLLGDSLFNTPSPTGKGRTLKQIFEDETVLTVWFDIRSDADSLYGNFKVRLAGVIDLQIMEMATRECRPFYRHGLDRCIEDIPEHKLAPGAKEDWANKKYVGKNICRGSKGYGIFDTRPLPRELEEYAINDIELMPELFDHYFVDGGLSENKNMMDLVMRLSDEAVGKSIALDYPGNTRASRFGLDELKFHDRFGPYDLYDEYDLEYY